MKSSRPELKQINLSQKGPGGNSHELGNQVANRQSSGSHSGRARGSRGLRVHAGQLRDQPGPRRADRAADLFPWNRPGDARRCARSREVSAGNPRPGRQPGDQRQPGSYLRQRLHRGAPAGSCRRQDLRPGEQPGERSQQADWGDPEGRPQLRSDAGAADHAQRPEDHPLPG